MPKPSSLLIGVCLLAVSCGEARSPKFQPSAEDAFQVAYSDECKPQNAKQREWTRLSLEVLEKFPSSHDIYSGAALSFMRSDVSLCHDDGLDERAANAVVASGHFPRWIRSSRQLSVAHRLAPHNDQIVQTLGQIAFAEEPISNGTSSDIRPRARSVLASLGPDVARRWSKSALTEMNGENSLGTGAAQIVAATGEPELVLRVADLLESQLPSEKGSVLRRRHNRRTIELAYALGAAGESANPYLHLIQHFMTMKVEDTGYGEIITRQPIELCRVYAKLGEKGRALANAAPCDGGDWPIAPS